MSAHVPVAIVTIATLILYFVMILNVGRARAKYGVEAPAIIGHADFERVFRVQANTLEWLPIFLPSLWLFAAYWGGSAWGEWIAAALGVMWIVGRALYMTGYTKAAGARSTGFLVQILATAILLVGALGRMIMLALHL